MTASDYYECESMRFLLYPGVVQNTDENVEYMIVAILRPYGAFVGWARVTRRATESIHHKFWLGVKSIT